MMTDDVSRRRLRLAKAVIAVGGLLFVMGGWWVWLRFPQWFAIDNARRAVETIRSLGVWGVLLSIALMTVHSFLPFPAEFVAVANGVIYGPFWGSVITWVGAMIGAASAFAVVRVLGRPFVNRMLPARRQLQLASWSHNYGGSAILVSRRIPVIAFNLINYASALSDVSFGTFLWTTAVGILPLTIGFAVLGDRLLSGWGVWAFLAGAAVVAVAWWIGRRIWRRKSGAEKAMRVIDRQRLRTRN
jgi:uncharacterized membrane protein YdjX (TVP38/TMEM64 family)